MSSSSTFRLPEQSDQPFSADIPQPSVHPLVQESRCAAGVCWSIVAVVRRLSKYGFEFIVATKHNESSANGFASSNLYGGTDLDGTVNATDLNALALHWRTASATWSSGDFNGDGVVNAADLNDLALNWQQSIASAASPVPEPATWWHAVTCLLFVGFRREVKRNPGWPSLLGWR